MGFCLKLMVLWRNFIARKNKEITLMTLSEGNFVISYNFSIFLIALLYIISYTSWWILIGIYNWNPIPEKIYNWYVLAILNLTIFRFNNERIFLSFHNIDFKISLTNLNNLFNLTVVFFFLNEGGHWRHVIVRREMQRGKLD